MDLSIRASIGLSTGASICASIDLSICASIGLSMGLSMVASMGFSTGASMGSNPRRFYFGGVTPPAEPNQPGCASYGGCGWEGLCAPHDNNDAESPRTCHCFFGR